MKQNDKTTVDGRKWSPIPDNQNTRPWAFVLASYIYTPDPWKGSIGVALGETSFCTTKKAVPLDCFFVERKTRLELATPTLARLCSTN